MPPCSALPVLGKEGPARVVSMRVILPAASTPTPRAFSWELVFALVAGALNMIPLVEVIASLPFATFSLPGS